MKCALCSREFRAADGRQSCPGCPLQRRCRRLRCPHCGYENVPEPAWVGKLRAWRKRLWR